MTRTKRESSLFFVYGSLRDRDVLGVVLGRDVSAEIYHNARLPGFRLAKVPDETYPVILREAHATTEGAVLFDLTSEDWNRIRFFESEEYGFSEYPVWVEGMGNTHALVCEEAVMEGGAWEPWSLDEWRRLAKRGYLHSIRRYMAFYGQGTIEEAEALWLELAAGKSVDD